MYRLVLFLTLAVLCLLRPAAAQQRPAPDERVGALPPEALPLSKTSLLSKHPPALRRPGALGEAELMRRVGQLYGYQASILSAQAEGDLGRAAQLFDQAIPELRALLQQPGITGRPRFRALYRALVTEYENFHGAPLDSLTLPQGDIFAFREAAFAALNGGPDPLLEDAAFPDTPPVRTDIPLTRNRLVRQSVSYLLRADGHVPTWLSRAGTYFPMIEQILREEGLPDELKYLALVESGLNPQAKSWARAVGLWQFMASTGRAYDLQINSWIDERRDPEKATRAAARHLADLYERFDDWHLALAAYNAGAGNVSRALRRARRARRAATFWGAYPYLPRETRGYVPMFIATALVVSNPSAFDVEDAPAGPAYAYDHVPLSGSLSLRDVAELSGASLSAIRALNPELRRAYTPPSDGAYFVRIPQGTYARFAAGYAALPKDKKRPVAQYVVRRGNTLGGIAARLGVSVSALRQRNGLRGSLIHPGQHLVVPVPHYEADLSLADADPVTVHYSQRRTQPLVALSDWPRPQQERPQARHQASTPPVEQVVRTASAAGRSKLEPAQELPAKENPAREERAEPKAERTTYTVRRGDTMGEIAERYGVRLSQLRAWNDLRSSRLRVGHQLAMYGAEEPAAQRLAYRVRPGDTLSEIAHRHGVSVRQLRAWNELRSSRIRPGQRLTLHTGRGAMAAHEVQRGDSLDAIAHRYGVSVRQLKAWNELSSNIIHPGQRLKVGG